MTKYSYKFVSPMDGKQENEMNKYGAMGYRIAGLLQEGESIQAQIIMEQELTELTKE